MRPRRVGVVHDHVGTLERGVTGPVGALGVEVAALVGMVRIVRPPVTGRQPCDPHSLGRVHVHDEVPRVDQLRPLEEQPVDDQHPVRRHRLGSVVDVPVTVEVVPAPTVRRARATPPGVEQLTTHGLEVVAARPHRLGGAAQRVAMSPRVVEVVEGRADRARHARCELVGEDGLAGGVTAVETDDGGPVEGLDEPGQRGQERVAGYDASSSPPRRRICSSSQPFAVPSQPAVSWSSRPRVSWVSRKACE